MCGGYVRKEEDLIKSCRYAEDLGIIFKFCLGG